MNALATFEPEAGEAKVQTFNTVGPVAETFINDPTFISTIMGPYGSAKTTSCFQKILRVAALQHPSPVDGVRRIRVCVIRATYAQLETNVMADWFSWFPRTKENYNGETKTQKLRFHMPPLGIVEVEMLFRALGDLKAEEIFKGMAITLLWLNEVDTLDLNVLKFGLPRVGRFPMAKDGGCAWSGVIADMNAPDVDNWTYELLVDDATPLHVRLGITEELCDQMRALYGGNFGIAFHRQPGGRTPEAENLANLPDGYYDKMMLGLSENEIRRFVDNEFGAVNNGQPVYPEFNDGFHVAKAPLKPLPGLVISAGLDGGSTPAAVFGQEAPDGQVRILDELVVFNQDKSKALERMGPIAFARECRRFIAERWPNARIGDLWFDPAAFYGEHDEDLAWATTFAKEFGAKVKPSPVKGNRLTPRLEAVRTCLTRNVGAKPGMVVSPTCKHLRRGFNNGYVIQRVRLSNGSGRWKDEPDKNDFSHVHDALQYLVCGLRRKGSDVLDDMDARAAARRQRERVSFGGGYFSGRGPAAAPDAGTGRFGTSPRQLRERRERGRF